MGQEKLGGISELGVGVVASWFSCQSAKLFSLKLVLDRTIYGVSRPLCGMQAAESFLVVLAFGHGLIQLLF